MGTTTGPASVTRSRWLLGTSMTAVTLVAGGWFLAIGPTLDDAEAARADAASVTDRNAMLQVQLSSLAGQHERLPELQSELATLRSQIPADADLAALLDELDALADTHGVTLIGVSPGTPTPVVPGAAPTTATTTAPAQDGAADPAADGSTDASGVDAAAVPAADPSAVPAVVAADATQLPGFVAVPVELTALGSTPDVLAFLGALQRDTTRLFLVSALTGTGQAEAEATGSQPGTEPGDVRMRVSGYVYVLQDEATSTAPATDPGAAPLPTPTTPPAFAGG